MRMNESTILPKFREIGADGDSCEMSSSLLRVHVRAAETRTWHPCLPLARPTFTRARGFF